MLSGPRPVSKAPDRWKAINIPLIASASRPVRRFGASKRSRSRRLEARSAMLSGARALSTLAHRREASCLSPHEWRRLPPMEQRDGVQEGYFASALPSTGDRAALEDHLREKEPLTQEPAVPINQARFQFERIADDMTRTSHRKSWIKCRAWIRDFRRQAPPHPPITD